MNLTTNNGERGKYLLINYMNVKQGDENNYLEVENSIWKPVHQDLVNSKAKSGWDIWSMTLPGGSGADYQFMAVDGYNDFSQISNVNYSEVFRKIHQNKNQDELMERTHKSRTWLKSELWESLDSVTQ